MKFRMLYTLFLLIFGAAMLLNSSGGPGFLQNTDLSGSPLGFSTCGNCHIGNMFNPSISAQLLKNDVPTTEYEPEEDYTLRLVVNVATGSPARYGFHTVALQGTNNANAGTFDSPPAGFRISTVNNRRYAEHSSPRPTNTLEIKWKAPAAGSGAVRFYAAGIAANGNGSSSGDGAAVLPQPLVIGERIASNLGGVKLLPITMTVFPNPVQDVLNLRIEGDKNGLHTLQLLDAQGREWLRRVVQLRPGSHAESLPVEDLPAGLYILRLMDTAQGIYSVKMIKN